MRVARAEQCLRCLQLLELFFDRSLYVKEVLGRFLSLSLVVLLASVALVELTRHDGERLNRVLVLLIDIFFHLELLDQLVLRWEGLVMLLRIDLLVETEKLVLKQILRAVFTNILLA